MKLSHVFLFLVLICNCLPVCTQTIFPPLGISQEQLPQLVSQKKAQHEVEFAFDIHKVLIHKKKNAMWSMIREYPHKIRLVKTLWNLPLMITLGSLVFQGIINVLPWNKHKYKEVTSEQFVHGLRNAQLTELVQFVIRVLNAQLPDPLMEQLVRELKQKGYRLRVASNIGRQIYVQLKEQLSLLGNTLFDQFDKDEQGMEGKTIDYTLSTAEKPSDHYYTEYLDHNDPDRKKLIIFVDDKLVNIEPATRQGFLGIHFKNAEQLRTDLIALGIFD